MSQPPAREDLSSLRSEVERAASHYYHTPLQQGIDNRTKMFVIERCLKHVVGPSVLELGYVDGLWTDALRTAGYSIDIVEGASRHVEHARDRYRNDSQIRVFHSLFQEFEPDRRYDTIIAGDMLRYLPDPCSFLIQARGWLGENGRLIATLPNSLSLHRRIGSYLGIEGAPTELNARDKEVGNRRCYDRHELQQLLQQAGYEVEELKGCFLKPLSSAQMENWSDELLRAYLAMGDELQDYCWFLYAVGCAPVKELQR